MPRIYAPTEGFKQAFGQVDFVNGVAGLPAGADVTKFAGADYTIDARQHSVQPLDKLSIDDLWLLCDQLEIDLNLDEDEIPTRYAMVAAITAEIAGTLGTLTVSAAQGEECGDTAVTISGDGEGTLVYSLSLAAYVPVWYEDLAHLPEIEDGDEITAPNGRYVNVFELDGRGRCVAYGSAQAVSETNDDIELAKILSNTIKVIDWWHEDIGYPENTKEDVEAALLINAQALVEEDYVVAIEEGSTYDTGTRAWVGKLSVTCPGGTHTAVDAENRTLTLELTPVPAIAELAKVVDATIEILPDATANTANAVKAAILANANGDVGEGYTVTVVGTPTYDTATRVWVGKLKVTADDDENDTATDASNRTLAIVPEAFGSDAELAKIEESDITTVPFGTENTKTAVETELLILANGEVGAGFTVSIMAGSTYDTETKAWSGKLVVQADAVPLDFSADAVLREYTISIAAE